MPAPAGPARPALQSGPPPPPLGSRPSPQVPAGRPPAALRLPGPRPPARACAARAAARTDGSARRAAVLPGAGPLQPRRGGRVSPRPPSSPGAAAAPRLALLGGRPSALSAFRPRGRGGGLWAAPAERPPALGSPSTAGGMVRPTGRALLPRSSGAEGGGAEGPTCSARAGAARRPRCWGAGPAGPGGSRGCGASGPPRPCRARCPASPRRCSRRSSTTRWATSTRRYPASTPPRPRAPRARVRVPGSSRVRLCRDSAARR